MPKTRNQKSTSKGGRKATGYKIPNTDVYVKPEYPGQDPKMTIHPGPAMVEKPTGVLPAAARKHQYPPPKTEPTFVKVWMQYIDNITGRENFKVGHLNSLAILCDLYVEMASLQLFIQQKGRSYLTCGRNGDQWRFYPEVGQLSKVQAQIKEYQKALGLFPRKDKDSASGGEADNWE